MPADRNCCSNFGSLEVTLDSVDLRIEVAEDLADVVDEVGRTNLAGHEELVGSSLVMVREASKHRAVIAYF